VRKQNSVMPPKKSRKAGGGSRAPTRKAKKSKPAAAKSKAKAKAAANSGSGRQKPLTAYFGKNATVSGAAASGRSGSTSSRYTTGAAGGAGGAAASSSSRQPPRPPAGPQSSSPSDTESETSDSEAEPPAAPASYPGAGVASASSVAAISSRAAVTTGNASNPKPAAGAANVHPQRPMLPPPPAKKSVVKARTAYVYFCKLNKDVLSQRYFEKTGKHPTTELLADALSDRFQRLKPEQRKIYEEHEKIDAIRYKFEKRNFETFSLPTTGGVGSSIFGGSASSSSSNQDATIAAELGSLLRTAAQECPSVVTTAQGLPRDFLDAVRDLDALLTSTAKGLIRKKYGDRGGDGSSTGSSSAWKRILAQWTFPEDAPAVGGGGSSAPRAAGDYRYTMTERLNGEDVFANSGDSKVAQSVEQALFEHHAGVHDQFAYNFSSATPWTLLSMFL